MDVAAQAAARAELEADLEALRRHGVKSFGQTPSGFTVEFWPTEAPDVIREGDSKLAGPDLCRCGHPEHAHVNGYCVEGCNVEACSPAEKATP